MNYWDLDDIDVYLVNISSTWNFDVLVHDFLLFCLWTWNCVDMKIENRKKKTLLNSEKTCLALSASPRFRVGRFLDESWDTSRAGAGADGTEERCTRLEAPDATSAKDTFYGRCVVLFFRSVDTRICVLFTPGF